MIVGNLGLNDSTMAEVNHSSVVAHLGMGSIMAIMLHLTKLLQRQQHLYNKERALEMRARVAQYKYKSKFRGDAATEDTVAKQKLTIHAHDKLFTKVFKQSSFLSHRFDDNNNCHIIWN